tara:strand:+ start:1849 stop:2031 length:183 start_codon:yes stop_codon:yes gene_type:complete
MNLDCSPPECYVICSKQSKFTEEDKEILVSFLGRWKYRQLREMALDISLMCKKKIKNVEK